MVSERRSGAARDDRVRVGIIGLGAVAQAVYLPLIDRLVDHFAVTAVCDLSPSLVEALADRYRVPADGRFTEADALIASGAIDAVVVLSSGSHGAVAAAAMRRGLPVLCEKPLALTLAEADRLESIASSTAGARLQLGYMKLYDPAVVAARRWLDTRGDVRRAPRSIEVTVLHPPSEPQLAHARLLPPPDDVPAAALGSIRAAADALAPTALGDAPLDLKRLYSGILLGSVVHELALIRRFAGDPTEIDDVDAWPADSWPPSVAISGRLPGDSRFSI